MSSLPRPLRAAIGLAATAVDNVRSAPQKALELPMSAVSSALQFSLRAQQRYAELLVRGDEALGHLHGVPDLPPAWATFDEDALEPEAFDAAPALSVVADVVADVEVEPDDIEPDDLTDTGGAPENSQFSDALAALAAVDPIDDVPAALSVVAAAAVVPNPVPVETPTEAPTETPAVPVAKAPAKKASSAKRTAAPPKEAPAKKAASKAAPKKVTTPRTGKPSAFDSVVDPDAL